MNVPSGYELEAITAGVREYDILERQHQPRLRSGPASTTRRYLGLSLDREDALAAVLEQVCTERLRPGLIRRPLHDENDCHASLNGREPRGAQLIEDADDIESAIRSVVRLITEKCE